MTVILIALATYRLTRLVTTDKITEGARLRLQLWFEARWEARTKRSSGDTWGSKLAYLLSCDWCASIWIAAAVTTITATVTAVPLPIATALTASAVTGLISQLSHIES